MKFPISAFAHNNITLACLPFLFILSLSVKTIAQKNLKLSEARQLASKQNKKLIQAQYNIEAARAVQQGTQGLNKPAIDGSVSAFHVGKPLSSMLPAVGVSPSVTISQSIYAAGKIKLGQAAAAKGVEIYEQQKALSETEVLLNVEKAYWQIASVNEKIILANRYKVLLESLENDLSNSFNAGMIYKNDLLRVRVQRNENELNLAKANDGLILSKLNLAQIIGMSGDANIVISDSVTGPFQSIAGDSLLNAADSRVEIVLLRKSLEAQELQKKLLQADFKPTVGLLAGGFAGVGKKMNFTNDGNTIASYFGMVSVNIPILDWGQKASKVKEQTYRINAQQSQIEETRELLSLEVQDAYMNLNQSARKIQLSNASVVQAEENLRLSNDRFKAGTITGQDVLEAQTLWQQANSNVIDAKVDYKINEAVYRKAIGEIR
jgi:outer membrane protein